MSTLRAALRRAASAISTATPASLTAHLLPFSAAGMHRSMTLTAASAIFSGTSVAVLSAASMASARAAFSSSVPRGILAATE